MRQSNGAKLVINLVRKILVLLICLFFYGYIYLENNKVDSYSKQYKKVTINHQQLPLLMGQKVNDNLLCMEPFDISKIMPFILYSHQEEQRNILDIPLTRIESAFFDRFVDREQAVLLFEDLNEEIVIPGYALPDKAKPGTWVSIWIDKNGCTRIGVNEEKTSKEQQQTRKLIEQLERER
ncbi:DUF3006 domain-containing protein [Virgibacillus sp. MSJ-26]|uniref:DUF3006 domain-containing protein n=1 Tax=Virgibacillus sp. MSJ-26 TaxID=2841522 RepID=UPI001C115324|nr:DUF3006 domain-containing protein [Virgibacillus sp. MSJ-26]